MNTPNYPHPLIAREGWPILGVSVLLAVVASLWWPTGLAILLWLFALFTLAFLRDPVRQAPDGDNLVLCPADGRIVSVEEAADPYLDGRRALKISIFMNVFNVHSNRMPVAGRVQAVRYFAGRFFNAALDKASAENERNAVVVHLPDGRAVTVVQVAGLVARRIVCHVHPEQPVYAGQRFGFIRFGSRVEVFLPPDSQARVALGDHVRATATVLAVLQTAQTEAPQAEAPQAADDHESKH